ncbi:hypothetical protein AVEN_260984-1 [Araneus ventricosus]|uniref:Uncharacterized protein n=1 Tax=Araneus ventricosus TaxID=182803 RepID=A0A4Y2THM2_ARAVE|nr:hypothetical protein AVEN_260984-1 [Araneus ventricosus]
MASGTEAWGGVLSIHVSHVHSTDSVAAITSGMEAWGGILSIHVSHVHSTGSVTVMASGTGAWDGVLSIHMYVNANSKHILKTLTIRGTPIFSADQTFRPNRVPFNIECEELPFSPRTNESRITSHVHVSRKQLIPGDLSVYTQTRWRPDVTQSKGESGSF